MSTKKGLVHYICSIQTMEYYAALKTKSTPADKDVYGTLRFKKQTTVLFV